MKNLNMTQDINNIEERALWYWFCGYVSISVRTKTNMLYKLGSPEKVFQADSEKLSGCGLSGKQIQKICESKNNISKILDEYHKLGQRNINFITINDSGYPEKLKNIYEPPLGLFVKGKLPDKGSKTAAIVGARDCSHYGAETACWFGRELAEAGVQVISGMASGIDSKGLWGALSCGGEAYGVLGSGADVVYPPENQKLYESILNRGGIISEYIPGTKPLAYHFPQRNRIISGLADCIIVVEARKRSGSLITADLALEQGRDVAAVPGRHSDALSEGTNSLIKNGAYLVTSPEEVLDIMGVDCGQKVKNKISNQFTLDKRKEKVYSCLHLEPKYIETIIEDSAVPYGEVLEILVELEMDGIIKQTSKNYYAKCIG